MLKYLWRSANTERLFFAKKKFFTKRTEKTGCPIRDKE